MHWDFEKNRKNLLTNPLKYDTIRVQGKGRATSPNQKKLKKSWKTLDKSRKVCYNKDVERENLQKKGIDTMTIITVSHEEKSPRVYNVCLTLYRYEEELYLPEELREY